MVSIGVFLFFLFRELWGAGSCYHFTSGEDIGCWFRGGSWCFVISLAVCGSSWC